MYFDILERTILKQICWTLFGSNSNEVYDPKACLDSLNRSSVPRIRLELVYSKSPQNECSTKISLSTNYFTIQINFSCTILFANVDIGFYKNCFLYVLFPCTEACICKRLFARMPLKSQIQIAKVHMNLSKHQALVFNNKLMHKKQCLLLSNEKYSCC